MGKAERVGSVVPVLLYRDAARAIEWLGKAFGFEEHLVVPGEDGRIVHAELTLGNGMIMIGTASGEGYGKVQKAPGDVGGVGTSGAYVIVGDADIHYERAVAAGAEVIIALHDATPGGRGYTCRDLEGHVWNFGTYDPWELKDNG